mgnify:CR=1 FL=1
MTPLDWFLVALYLVLSLGIAAFYARRASKDTTEFFASGRGYRIHSRPVGARPYSSTYRSPWGPNFMSMGLL